MPKKGDIFPEKKDGRHFVYVLEYMLTLVSLDKMHILKLIQAFHVVHILLHILAVLTQ